MREFFSPASLDKLEAALLPSSYRFEGNLLVKDDRAWLEVRGNGSLSLAILDDHFVERLMESVPCFVGGENLYDDPVILEGSLVMNGDSFAIGSVETGRLLREGEGEYDL